MLILLLSLGLFFALSGFHKLFVPSVRTNFLHLCETLHLPKPMWYAVPAGEFVGGLGLLASMFVVIKPLIMLDAALLMVILIGAICTDCYKEIAARKPKWDTIVQKSMMQPEILLCLMLASIIMEYSR